MDRVVLWVYGSAPRGHEGACVDHSCFDAVVRQSDRGKPLIELNDDRAFGVASVHKVLILSAYARAVVAGRLDPAERVAVADIERWYWPGTDGGAHPAALEDWHDRGVIRGHGGIESASVGGPNGASSIAHRRPPMLTSWLGGVTVLMSGAARGRTSRALAGPSISAVTSAGSASSARVRVGFLSGAPHLLYAPTPTRLELVVTTLRSSTIRSDGSFQGEHGSRITFVEVVEERLVVHSSTR